MFKYTFNCQDIFGSLTVKCTNILHHSVIGNHLYENSCGTHIHNKRQSCKVVGVLQTFHLFTLITVINHFMTVSISYGKKKNHTVPRSLQQSLYQKRYSHFLKAALPRVQYSKCWKQLPRRKTDSQTKFSLTQDKEPNPTRGRVSGHLKSGR